MVLIGFAGFALERWAELQGALLPALLLGLVVASFVPARSACPIRRPPARD